MHHGGARAAIVAALVFAPSLAAAPDDPVLRRLDGIVERDFYSPDVLRDRDWRGLVAQAAKRLDAAATPDARAIVFRELLAGLKTSHTDYLPRSDPRHADLAAIFRRVIESNPERCPAAVRPAFPVRVDDIGVWWLRAGKSWFVAALHDGGPAQAAGLRLGDEVLAADGAAFAPVAAFAGKAGREVQLEYRRTRDGSSASLAVVPRTSEPLATYAAATRDSARVIEHAGRRIGYVRLWSGVGDAPQEARNAIRELNAKNLDGFILDIRDGWGGVPPDFVSVFDRSVPVLVSSTRDGESVRFDGQIRVPAIVLVNEGVRSGKEVLAYAVRKHRLATLLGVATPGALLPGTAYCLDDGALLYLAVGTTRIDGEVREGQGIDPDVVVPFDVRWASGADVQLDAAVARLAR